jgi:integrase
MGLGVARRGSAKQAGDSVTGARDSAHAARELLRQGLDPIDERDRQRAADKQSEQGRKADKAREHLTLCRAAREYHERVVEPRLTTKHSAQWIASLEHHVPAETWHKPIAEVTAPELLAALSGVRALADSATRVPETLSRVRQRLDAVFEDAIFHGRCTSNPAAAIRRKMRETIPSKKPGEHLALPYRELPRFMALLRDAQGIAARSLDFALHTASRTSEVLLAEWSEFNLEEAVWVIPAERMKAKEAHTVYLSPRALEILQAHKGLHARYVFPSVMLEDSPQSNMAMLAVLDRISMRDRTTVHGICRATFSTWANETAAARSDVIEACLAHKEADKVKAAYNRAQFSDERKALMNAWATYLARPDVSNVVPIAA